MFFTPADWVNGLLSAINDTLGKFYTWLLQQIINNIFTSTLPTVDQLSTGWFTLGIGGTYGLAVRLMSLVAVAVAFVIVITPFGRHGLRISRTWSSMVGLAVFSFLFYPVYSLLYRLAQASLQGMLNVSLGAENVQVSQATQAILALALPSDSVAKLGAIIAASGFGFVAGIESYVLMAALYVVLLVYPLAIVFRAASEWTNALFNACNSAIIVVLLSPVVMGAGFLLPIVIKGLPMGSSGLASFVGTFVGGLFAAIAPLLIAYFVFQKSSEMFGQVSAHIDGSVDVSSMPPSGPGEIQDSVSSSRHAGLKAFGESMGAGILTADLGNSGDMWGDVKKLGIEAISTAAAVTGHPWVAAALNTVDTTTNKERRAHESEDFGASYVPQVPTQTPTVAPTEPVVESPVTTPDEPHFFNGSTPPNPTGGPFL